MNYTYTRGVDTPYPNRYSKKAYVSNAGVVLARPIIPYMKVRKFFYFFSALVVLVSLVSIFTRGLNLGLDFTGGTVLEVSYQQKVVTGPQISEILSKQYPGLDVTSSGPHETSIRIPAKLVQDSTTSKVQEILRDKVDPTATITSSEFVGPKAGADLVYASVMSLVFTIVMILIYVSVRFQWRLSLGAVGALLHDTIVTIGVFSLFQVDVDMNFVAAILSVIGYSINDTIVVFDRMRENIRKLHKCNVEQCINISLTETLNRTIMTSFTTLIVVVILLVFGGASLYVFSLALFIGIFFGTYSSIYIAVALAFDIGLTKEDMLIRQVNKDGLEEYETL